MREEQRAAAIGADRQRDAVVVCAGGNRGSARSRGDRPIGLDRIARRRYGHHIDDQALVPAMEVMVERTAVVRAPMPVERLATVAVYQFHSISPTGR